MSSSTSRNRAVRVPQLDITLKASSSRKPRTLDGFPLAFAVIALTAAIIPFGYWAALGLLVLIVLTPVTKGTK